jgi:CRISPR type I-E-associated protein CasB/Cse2
MAFRLQQAVKFALSKQASVDWPALLEDLRQWTHPKKIVQKRWARSFYAVHRLETQVANEDADIPAATANG